jgi:hypothetical protein
MKITATKIKRLLIEKHGWHDIAFKGNPAYDTLIKDVLTVIDNELRMRKNISIKGK